MGRNKLWLFGIICFIMLFTISFEILAQDCPDCSTDEIGTIIFSREPVPLEGDIRNEKNDNLQLKSNSSQVLSLGSADGSIVLRNGIYRYAESIWTKMDINDPIIYMGNEKIRIDTRLRGTTDGEWWHEELKFPDDTRIIWNKRFYRNNHFYSESGEQISSYPTEELDQMCIAGIRCKPEGEWELTFYHNDIPVFSKIITCKGEADPEVVKHGEDFRQGKYDNKDDEKHHMDNACRFPDDKASHFCSNPLAIKDGKTEKRVTIKQIGCALTSCAIMLNYNGINVIPPRFKLLA